MSRPLGFCWEGLQAWRSLGPTWHHPKVYSTRRALRGALAGMAEQHPDLCGKPAQPPLLSVLALPPSYGPGSDLVPTGRAAGCSAHPASQWVK